MKDKGPGRETPVQIAVLEMFAKADVNLARKLRRQGSPDDPEAAERRVYSGQSLVARKEQSKNMKITRRGSSRDRGQTILLNREAKLVLGGLGLKLQVASVPHHSDPFTHHDYSVELSREELLQIIGKLLVDPLIDTAVKAST